MELVDDIKQSVDEKMEIVESEKKVEVKSETIPETKSLPLEPYQPFGEIKSKIRSMPPGSDGLVAPSDKQLTADDLDGHGIDVGRDIDIQEMGFLSVLNLLPDEKARAEFLKWAKLESLKSTSKEKTEKDIKISRSVRVKPTLRATHNSRTDVKKLTRSRVPPRTTTAHKKHERVSGRPGR